ncbi:MAG: hypothetical protein HFE97_12135 [Oscillospiraceae bacterium]|nr:hypothetical protein [Oscillospiraceae bacterium]
MRLRFFPLALALILALGGCASILNRPYQVITPHAYRASTASGSSGIPDAGTYQDLVNQIFSFVEDGVQNGVIRLKNYNSKTGDVAGDLSAACNEVANDDPLGAYAVDFIKSDYTRVVKYYEVNIQITYRRTQEQVKNLVNVTGTSAIRAELKDALASFQPECALRVGYFNADQDNLASLIRQAYYDTPEAAFGMPEYTITLYPDQAPSGPRIVEILLSYPKDPDLLRKAAEQLRKEAALVLSLSYDNAQGQEAALVIHAALQERVTYTTREKGKNTTQAALLDGTADSEGMALAFQLLAQQLELECVLVQGSLEGAPHFWNQIRQTDGTWRHIDATQPAALLTDEALLSLGYQWNTEQYHTCRDTSAERPETQNLAF